MHQGILRKSIVFLIVLLFIGANLVSVTGRSANENGSVLLEKQDNSSNEQLFDLKIKLLMKLGHMPSLSASIIKNNSIVWSKGYGFYDIWHRKQASEDTIYMIGSISKSITATALMQLYEQGLFGLDEDVNNYLPFSLRNPNYPDIPITFRMLLAHQSGIFDHTISLRRALKILFKSLPIPEDPYPWLKEFLAPGGSVYDPELWMDYPPGAEANYSNVGFVVLGYLIELIANQSIEQYCQENIFTPLHMMNTSFHPSNLDRDRFAIPYVRMAGFYIPLPHYDLHFAAPAGGIRTTVEDLSHFLIAHMNGGIYNSVRIIKNKTVEMMHTVQYPDCNYRSSQFGLGWIIQKDENGETYEGHGGGGPGCIANMVIRSSDKAGVIYFFNQYKGYYSRVEKWARSHLDQVLFQKADEL